MKDYYRILGVLDSASQQEIKRAYRILARRYHPDLNLGGDTGEKFRLIQEAYGVLGDPDKRKQYDIELEEQREKDFKRRLKEYDVFLRSRLRGRQGQRYAGKSSKVKRGERERRRQPFSAMFNLGNLGAIQQEAKAKLASMFSAVTSYVQERLSRKPLKVSIIEASISVEESIIGGKKKIEIVEPEGIRKVSIDIPAGVRDGSVIRLRNMKDSAEELVVVVRLASHPFLSIRPKGLVVNVPVTVKEALYGAQIKVPGIEDSVMLKIPPGVQSGTELRIKGKGIKDRRGKAGDLFVRILITVPNRGDLSGLKEKIDAIDEYYEGNPREVLPESILGNR